MDMLGQFLCVQRNLGQEDEIGEITLQPEIWCHDTVYHEMDHCMKWPHSTDVRIFLSQPAGVLSFSERLVIDVRENVNKTILWGHLRYTSRPNASSGRLKNYHWVMCISPLIRPTTFCTRDVI